MKERIEKDMNEVIETSQKIRDYLLDDNVDLNTKRQRLGVYKTALEANKNIVSSSIVKISVEKLFK